jgi:hypothetical protein
VIPRRVFYTSLLLFLLISLFQQHHALDAASNHEIREGCHLIVNCAYTFLDNQYLPLQSAPSAGSECPLMLITASEAFHSGSFSRDLRASVVCKASHLATVAVYEK